MSAREQFSAVADRLNEAIVEAEERFRVGYCVRASVPMPPGEDDDGERELVFGKVCGRWALFVERAGIDSIPLLSTPLRWRLEAVPLIPRLAEALEAADRGVRRDVEAATTFLRAWLAGGELP